MLKNVPEYKYLLKVTNSSLSLQHPKIIQGQITINSTHLSVINDRRKEISSNSHTKI
jgi:hypothetical protein